MSSIQIIMFFFSFKVGVIAAIYILSRYLDVEGYQNISRNRDALPIRWNLKFEAPFEQLLIRSTIECAGLGFKDLFLGIECI